MVQVTPIMTVPTIALVSDVIFALRKADIPVLVGVKPVLSILVMTYATITSPYIVLYSINHLMYALVALMKRVANVTMHTTQLIELMPTISNNSVLPEKVSAPVLNDLCNLMIY